MEHTLALAIKDANGIPNITRQFATYDDLLAFVSQSTENAPVIMAMVRQQDGISFSLVPIAVIKPGISLLTEVPSVPQLPPTPVEVTVPAPVEPEVAPQEVEIASPSYTAPAPAELPSAVPAGYKKVGKRKSGTLVAGKHK